jgi:hypothetical protein
MWQAHMEAKDEGEESNAEHLSQVLQFQRRSERAVLPLARLLLLSIGVRGHPHLRHRGGAYGAG